MDNEIEPQEVSEHIQYVAADSNAEAVEPVAVEPETTPQPESTSESAPAFVDVESHAGMAVSGNAVDDVFLSKCVYKNAYSQKSLTVHHVQRRLVELGYHVAGADKDGWYGDLTKSAVEEFQQSIGVAGTGIADLSTLQHLFKNDSNVRVNP
jgi:peptidoglycan hydrolase-like protein with peptidoglycan-binding domain